MITLSLSTHVMYMRGTTRGGRCNTWADGREALICYDHVLTLDPHDGRAWGNKGVKLAALGRSEEALTCFDHALTLDPRDARGMVRQGGSGGQFNLGRAP